MQMPCPLRVSNQVESISETLGARAVRLSHLAPVFARIRGQWPQARSRSERESRHAPRGRVLGEDEVQPLLVSALQLDGPQHGIYRDTTDSPHVFLELGPKGARGHRRGVVDAVEPCLSFDVISRAKDV